MLPLDKVKLEKRISNDDTRREIPIVLS